MPDRGGNFTGWKRELLRQLRAASFRALPETVPAAEYAAAAGGYTTEPGIVVEPAGTRTNADADTRVRVVLNPDDRDAADLKLWADRFPRANVMAAFTRGSGPHRWTR